MNFTPNGDDSPCNKSPCHENDNGVSQSHLIDLDISSNNEELERSTSNSYALTSAETSIIIDWLTVTFCSLKPYDVSDFFDIRFSPEAGKSARYNEVYKWFSGATISHGLRNPKNDMASRVDLTGESLKVLNNQYGLDHYTILTLIYDMADQFKTKFSVTRMDCALDVVGVNLLETCRSHIKHGAFTCMSKSRGRPRGFVDLSKDQSQTILLGTEKSEIQMRIYDKRQEMLDKKNIDIGVDMTRFELQLRRQRATQLFYEMIKAGPEKWALEGLGRIRGYLDFKDFKSAKSNSGKNINRAKSAKWWSLLCQSQIRSGWIPDVHKILDVEQYKVHFTKNYGKTLAEYTEAFGVADLLELISKSLSKIDPHKVYELKRQLKLKIGE